METKEIFEKLDRKCIVFLLNSIKKMFRVASLVLDVESFMEIKVPSDILTLLCVCR